MNKENYPKQIAALKEHGVNVRTLPDKVKQDWANSLATWPARRPRSSTLPVCRERRCWKSQ